MCKNMRSDDKTLSDIVIEKLDCLEKSHKERSFLSRIDMMFSVLVSLTLFLTGFSLNSLKPVDFIAKFGFSFLVSLLALLIYSLIGEFYAILIDHETLRFTYWMILFQGICFLAISGTYLAVFLLPIEIILSIGFFIGVPVIFAIIFSVLFIESLFNRYMGNLCYRKSRPRTRRNWLIPFYIGIAIIPTVTIASLIAMII
jgi:hypothetical protein